MKTWIADVKIMSQGVFLNVNNMRLLFIMEGSLYLLCLCFSMVVSTWFWFLNLFFFHLTYGDSYYVMRNYEAAGLRNRIEFTS